MAIEIRELRYFVHVARAGSFSRAADELHIAQPALSRQLHKLEEELGEPLLVRHGRGIRLTRAGTCLLNQAEAIMLQLKRIPALISAQEDSFAGVVTLGLPPIAGIIIAPEIMAAFRQRWPQGTLNLREGISTSLQEWLLDRRMDIAVLHNAPPLDGMDFVEVLTEHMVVVTQASTASRKAGGAIRFRDLGSLPLIMPSLPHSNRRLVEQAAMQHGIRLNCVLEVDSVPIIKEMVKRGFGSAILTFAAVSDECSRGELSARPITGPPLISRISIAIPTEARTSWVASEFLPLLRETIACLARSGAWAGSPHVHA